jgi:hypothetical protein
MKILMSSYILKIISSTQKVISLHAVYNPGMYLSIQTDRQTDRRTDGQAGRQVGRQAVHIFGRKFTATS